jgi:hypothetical protein
VYGFESTKKYIYNKIYKSIKYKSQLNSNTISRDTAKIIIADILDLKYDTTLIPNYELFEKAVNSTEQYYAIKDINYCQDTFETVDLQIADKPEFIANSYVVHNCTMYGDIAGYLAPIGDLWKTQVYEIARGYVAINKLPNSVVDVKPSAELSENQNIDEGKGDPLEYEYHDGLFSTWIEKWYKNGPEDTIVELLESTIKREITVDAARTLVLDLERWWNLYKGIAVSKRIQAPPVLAVSRRSFGFDHRESVLAQKNYFGKSYEAVKDMLFNGNDIK